MLTVEPTDAVLRSDCDEQLLITVAFTSKVKLHSIVMASGAANEPSHVKIFVNMPSLSFDDAEDAEPVQELDLDAKAVAAGDAIPLEFVRFQNVRSLTLFIDANAADDDVTELSHLGFIGSSTDGMDMSELKAVG